MLKTFQDYGGLLFIRKTYIVEYQQHANLHEEHLYHQLLDN